MSPPTLIVLNFARWLGYRRSSDLTEKELLNRLIARGMTPDEARAEVARAEDEALDEFFAVRFGIVGRNDDDGSKS